MAVGWLTVLKSLPWAEVISNAPAVAEGARKLWKAVARKSAPDKVARNAADSQANTAGEKTALETRTIALENAVTELREQMLASSELIKTLAEQNAQLVRHIETNRVRMLWLGALTAVAVIVAVTALYLGR